MTSRSRATSVAPGTLVAVTVLAVATIWVCVAGEANDLNSDLRRLAVTFRLDPRLTRSLYMGDRWVSPATYTRVGETTGVEIEVRVDGLLPGGGTIAVSPEWTISEPSMLTVTPGRAGEAKITVLRGGQCSVKLSAHGLTRELSVTATAQATSLRVDITQREVSETSPEG
jgi:hypothetical protein